MYLLTEWEGQTRIFFLEVSARCPHKSPRAKYLPVKPDQLSQYMFYIYDLFFLS